jgi:signal transduction histidine kinase
MAVSLLPDLSKIEIVNDCKGCSVLADSLFEQLFYNLLDNSLKHGEKVSKFRINCKMDKDGMKLIYENDEVGIPEDEKKKIFKEGYGKGTDVGLHMVKIMCNIYGWTMKETGKQR